MMGSGITSPLSTPAETGPMACRICVFSWMAHPEAGKWVWNNPIDRSDGEVRVRTETQEKLGAQPLALARTTASEVRWPRLFKG